MFCQKCGKEIEDGTRFCEHCGAAQDAAAAGNPGTNSNAGVNPTMQASPCLLYTSPSPRDTR